MRKFFAAVLLAILFATPALADNLFGGGPPKFGKKGEIPGVDQEISYKSLKVGPEGVTIILYNRSDKTYRFMASCSFIDQRRREVGDFYIDEVVIEPGETVTLKDLYLKGDRLKCKQARTLAWTIYKFEDVNAPAAPAPQQ